MNHWQVMTAIVILQIKQFLPIIFTISFFDFHCCSCWVFNDSFVVWLLRLQKNSGLYGDLNPDVCDAGAVLNQLNYQANWEHFVIWVDYKPIDAEIRMMIQEFVFEMWCGMNEFVHCIFAFLKHSFHSGLNFSGHSFMVKFIHSTLHFKDKFLYNIYDHLSPHLLA